MICVAILLFVIHQESTLMFMSHSVEVCVTWLLRALRITSHLIALLNLLALALDHYFAIVKPLDYPILMSRKRANILIVGFWILACFLGASDLYVPGPLFSYCEGSLLVNYCERVLLCSQYNAEYLLFSTALLCFVLMSVIYASIYIQLCRYHQMQRELRNRVKQNRKGLITTIIILVIFMVCWLPYCLFEVVMIIYIRHSDDVLTSIKYFKIIYQIDFYLFDVLLLNSILDAIVYSLRMREVRQGYRNMTRTCGSARTPPRRTLQQNSPLGSSTRLPTNVTTTVFIEA